MTIFFLAFLFLLLLFWRKKHVTCIMLLLISIVSIIAGFVVDYSMPFQGLKSLMVIIVMLTFSFLLYKPFTLLPKYVAIDKSSISYTAFSKYSMTMMIIGLFTMAIYLPIYIVVQNLNVDINQFKYDGGFDQFVYSGAFPVPIHLYILAIYLGDISILLLPLHFIYLQVGDNKKAILSFIGSLAFLFKGLVFFSRATPVTYALVYIFLFFTFKNSVSKKIVKKLMIVLVTGGLFLILGFVATSKDRFDSGEAMYGVAIKHTGDLYKYIDDPTIVSYFDYLGQGYYNSYHLLSRYDGSTFKSQVTFHEIYSLLNQFFYFPFSETEYMNRRQTLWPDKYWCSFNTYTCYMVYDFGLLFSFLITLFLSKKMSKHALIISNTNKISFFQVNYLTFFILLSSTSIFYSSLGGCIVPYIVMKLLYKFYG